MREDDVISRRDSGLHEGPPLKRRSKCNEAAQRVRWKFDTPLGRNYRRRMGTIEPVFANIQNKGLKLTHQAGINEAGACRGAKFAADSVQAKLVSAGMPAYFGARILGGDAAVAELQNRWVVG